VAIAKPSYDEIVKEILTRHPRSHAEETRAKCGLSWIVMEG